MTSWQFLTPGRRKRHTFNLCGLKPETSIRISFQPSIYVVQPKIRKEFTKNYVKAIWSGTRVGDGSRGDRSAKKPGNFPEDSYSVGMGGCFFPKKIASNNLNGGVEFRKWFSARESRVSNSNNKNSQITRGKKYVCVYCISVNTHKMEKNICRYTNTYIFYMIYIILYTHIY